MTSGDALRDGIRRVARAPAVAAGVWLVTLLTAVPLGLAVRESVETHLGASLEADTAATGVNYDWMQEFNQQASGLETTLAENVLAFAVVLDNLSAFFDGRGRPLAVLCAGAAYLTIWLFLAGGIIDRYARGRPTRAHGFFSVSAVFFFRFLRLALIAGTVYALMFGVVRPWLFDTVYTNLTRNMTAERTALLTRFGFYLLFGGVLAVFQLLFDYAKVRAVVEDRRSMIAAVVSATRFLSRNGGAAVALYLLNLSLFVVVLAAYALVAPGAGATGWSMWAGFAVGQAYVAGRLWIKLLFWASETALFQGRLAHAGYVARPAPHWPESPSAEAIARSVATGGQKHPAPANGVDGAGNRISRRWAQHRPGP